MNYHLVNIFKVLIGSNECRPMAKLGNGLHLFHKCGKTCLALVEEKKLHKTLLKLRISVEKREITD